MSSKILNIIVWAIIVLIINMTDMNKAEATQIKVNKRSDLLMKTEWGDCYNPEVKIVTAAKDREYRFYHCMADADTLIERMTGYFEIYYKSKKVYSEGVESHNFSVCDGNNPLYGCSHMPPPGVDINGDGIPEMVMEREIVTNLHSNRFIYRIYSVGKRVGKLVTVDGGYSSMGFKDLDGDGIYEVLGEDWVLAYYFGDFLSSPHPSIILKWQKGSYRLDLKHMKEHSPTLKELKIKAAELRTEFEDENRPFPEGYIVNTPDYQHAEAWVYLVDLIYSGNAKAAWTFLDMYWVIPPGCTKFKERKQEKREFIAALKKQLSRSLYWKDLKVLNSWR